MLEAKNSLPSKSPHLVAITMLKPFINRVSDDVADLNSFGLVFKDISENPLPISY